MRLTNHELIKSLNSEELASLLRSIVESEASEYMNWDKWLEASSPELIPNGTQILADIMTKTAAGLIVDRQTVPCVILADNIKLGGVRYYRIYEVDRKKITTVPQSQLEVTYI